MNVYDFDGTIYNGDSTIDFYIFCIRRHPSLIRCLPKQIVAAIKYRVKQINKTEFKEQFYCFLQEIDDIDLEVTKFWNIHENKVKEWFKTQKQICDVVISASPEFLLEGICYRHGITNLIASRVNKYTGKYTGLNCYGEEKVKQFKIRFPKEVINNFYSDSYSDLPMAKISQKSFIVKGNEIQEWEIGLTKKLL